MAHVRRELARVYRESRRGDIRVEQGKAFTYMLDLIGRTIERSDLEKRIEALEEGRNQ